MTRTTRSLRPLRSSITTAAGSAALALFLLAGCGAGSSDSPAASSDDAGSSADRLSEAEQAPAPAMDGSLASGYSDGAASVNSVADSPERALISQGNVALRSDDVGEARAEVQKVVDAFFGEISQEETATDDEGEVKRSRLVLRIPSEKYADAMQALEGTASLISSSSNIDDVTTKVIDTDIRLKVARKSIQRIQLLLDRAQSIRDIVNIESQLSRRQAALGSLERQQAYLASQTSMATITVSLERTKEKKALTQPKDDPKGFGAGLDKGWEAFKDVAISLSTAAGAALPFLIVLGLLAIPGVPLIRRRARRRSASA